MTHSINWIDRLRIERVVWALDQRLYDLPRRSRIAKRREVRENLLTAANDIGTDDAMRNLGNTRELAAEYRDAEFGDGPRPSWVAAATFFLTAQLFFTSLLAEAANAFGDGISAAQSERHGHVHLARNPLPARHRHIYLRRRPRQLGRRGVDASRVGALDRRYRPGRPAVADPASSTLRGFADQVRIVAVSAE